MLWTRMRKCARSSEPFYIFTLAKYSQATHTEKIFLVHQVHFIHHEDFDDPIYRRFPRTAQGIEFPFLYEPSINNARCFKALYEEAYEYSWATVRKV